MSQPTQAQIEAAAKAIQLKLEVYPPETSPAPWARWQTYSVAAEAALTAAQVGDGREGGAEMWDSPGGSVKPKGQSQICEPRKSTPSATAQVGDEPPITQAWKAEAAAQVGEHDDGKWKATAYTDLLHKLHTDLHLAYEQLEAVTIERCAQVALNTELTDERHGIKVRQQIAAAIRKLKDAP